MLAHKGIEHEEVHVEPVAHIAFDAGAGVQRDHGAGAADRRAPDPGHAGDRSRARTTSNRSRACLRPIRRARVLVEDAERRGEELQNAVRRLFYWAILRTAPTPKRRQAAEHHGAGDGAARRDLAELPGRIDEIHAWIADGILGGDALNAADFQIAPNVAWLSVLRGPRAPRRGPARRGARAARRRVQRVAGARRVPA